MEPNVIAEFFISGNTPSSKNSKRWTGKYIIGSKGTMKYIKEKKGEYFDQADRFKEALKLVQGPPYFIEFTFKRRTLHRFDYSNILQIVTDLMVETGWLEDDDETNIKPYFGNRINDKVNPGVIIKLLKQEPNHYDLQSK